MVHLQTWQLQRCALAWVTAILLCASGCTIPVSEHPLSDEKTSIFDERLIGHWEFAAEPAQKVDPHRFVVGRDAKADNVVEYAAVGLDGEQKIQINRGRLFVAKIGEAHYLSFAGDEPGQGYMIMRYDFKPRAADVQDPADPKSRDVGELHLMLAEVFASAIDKGELAGKVTRDKTSRNLKEIRITAKPDELKAFIEKHGAACFTPDALRMVRVDPK